MTELLLVRHGQTDSNLHGRWQGWDGVSFVGSVSIIKRTEIGNSLEVFEGNREVSLAHEVQD